MQVAWRAENAYRAALVAQRSTSISGYARIALSMLAAELPGSTLPLVLDPDPDDLTLAATDVLALASGKEDPDPQAIAAQCDLAALDRWRPVRIGRK